MSNGLLRPLQLTPHTIRHPGREGVKVTDLLDNNQGASAHRRLQSQHGRDLKYSIYSGIERGVRDIPHTHEHEPSHQIERALERLRATERGPGTLVGA